MRFLADENVPRQLIVALRMRGHDVIAASENYRGFKDRDLLAVIEALPTILVTEDQGFGHLVVRQGLRVAGVTILELRRLSPERYVDRAVSAIETNLTRLNGAIVIVEPARVRVRQF